MESQAFPAYEGSYPYIFISYSRKDISRVKLAVDAIHKAGYRVWWDAEIRIGQHWQQTLESHIRNCSAFLIFLSRHSIKSKECWTELQFCSKDEDFPVLPVMLEKIDDKDFPYEFKKLSLLQRFDLYDDGYIPGLISAMNLNQALSVCRRANRKKSGAAPQWKAADGLLWAIRKGTELIIKSDCGTEIPDYTLYTDMRISRAPWASSRSTVKNLTICKGVTSIGASSFYAFEHMERLRIPTGVSRIGHSAFQNCSRLASLILPEGLELIDFRAFQNCSELKSVQFPSSLKNIAEFAFFGCDKIERIRISGPVRVSEQAFGGCSSLSQIEIPDGIFEVNAFGHCDRTLFQ